MNRYQLCRFGIVNTRSFHLKREREDIRVTYQSSLDSTKDQ